MRHRILKIRLIVSYIQRESQPIVLPFYSTRQRCQISKINYFTREQIFLNSDKQHYLIEKYNYNIEYTETSSDQSVFANGVVNKIYTLALETSKEIL